MEDFFLKLDNLFGYIPGTDRQQEFTLFTKVDTNQNLMNLWYVLFLKFLTI